LVPVALGLLLTLGCEPEPRTVGARKPSSPTPSPTTPPIPPTPEESRPRDILGERTTDIRDAETEQRQRGAEVSTGKIVAKDPITIQGNAYVSIVGQASVLKIKHALDLFHAQNERYPANLDEFMNEIIKPNGIALPRLPYYQEYAYDAQNHSLVIMEYPARKEARQRELERQ
jgi:hypothetical protein